MEKESQNLLDNGILYDIEKVVKSGKYLFGANMDKLEAYFSCFLCAFSSIVSEYISSNTCQ